MLRNLGLSVGSGVAVIFLLMSGCSDDDYQPQKEDTATLCSDGLDNDGDSLIDCADPDCSGFDVCVESDCVDGVDNDQDGDTDCADSDCAGSAGCAEDTAALCGDGVDNDGDGDIDCLDSDCQATTACTEDTPTRCQDGIDNDGDGDTDCDDVGCQPLAICIPVENTDVLCSDDIDNDDDGDTDCDDEDCRPTWPCGGFCYTLDFERPGTFGMAIVEANDDEDTEEACVQYSVRIAAMNPQAGTQVCLYLDSTLGTPLACADPNLANPVIFPAVDLCQGTHSLYARVEQGLSSCQPLRMDVIVYEDPTCNVTLPADLSLDPGNPTLVNLASFSEVQVGTSGSQAELFVNNLPLPLANAVSGVVSFANVSLGVDGPVQLRATCYNPGSGTGSTQSAIRYLSKDTAAPLVTINSPTAGALFGATTCPIIAQVTVSGGVAGEQICAAIQGTTPGTGGCATLTGTVNEVHSLTVPCIDGAPAIIEAYTTDLHGNRGSATVEVVIDTGVPAVIIQSPELNRLYNKADDTINPGTNAFEHDIVACTDGDYNPANITLRVDGLNVTSITPTVAAAACGTLSHRITWSAPYAFSQPGTSATEHTVEVQVSDGSNTGSAQVTFRNDTVAPVISFGCSVCRPNVAFVTSADDVCVGAPMTVAGRVEVTGLEATRTLTLQVTKGGVPVGSDYTATSSGLGANYPSFNLPCGVELATGQNVLTVTATDAAGNPATPAVKNIAYGDGLITAPASGAILTAADDCDGGASYGISVATTYYNALADGTQVQVRASSAAGGWSHLSGTWSSNCSTQGATCTHDFCVSIPSGVEQSDIELVLVMGGTDVPGGPTGIIVDLSAPPVPTGLARTIVNRRAAAVELAWDSVTDPQTGLLTEWDVRCIADDTITLANWDSAMLFTGEPAPAAAGVTQTLVVAEDISGNKIRAGSSYSCGIRGRNAAGLWSDIATFALITESDVGFVEHSFTIDGRLRYPAWLYFPNIVPVGDVNGDGYDDFLVGYGRSTVGKASALYFGGLGGPSGSAMIDITCADNSFGASMAGLGDFDNASYSVGDTGKYPDFAIGAPEQGRVYLFRGRQGLGSTVTSLDCANADVVISDTSGDLFGSLLGAIGDFDNDGWKDIAIGSPNAVTNRGSVHIVFGRTEASYPVTINLTSGANADGALRYVPAGTLRTGAGLGGWDFNRDGFSDLVFAAAWGNANMGDIRVLHGWAVTKTPDTIVDLTDGDLEQTINSGAVTIFPYFGTPSIVPMDFNGDGCFDLVLGGRGMNLDGLTSPGVIQVFFGTKSGSDCTGLFTSVADRRIRGTAARDLFGDAVANVSNMTRSAPLAWRLNGLLTSPTDSAIFSGARQHNTSTSTDTGPGYGALFYAGFTGNRLASAADVFFTAPSGAVGYSWAAYLGDVDGDGYVDLAMGDPEFASNGRIWIYR